MDNYWLRVSGFQHKKAKLALQHTAHCPEDDRNDT